MSWLQILIPVLFVLGPVLGQIIKKINEQAELRRIEMERQRIRDEMLRTGRAPAEAQSRESTRSAPRPTPQGGAAARTNLEEIAKRRQAQLEELRRRQQAARAQASARPTPARPVPPTAPGRPGPQAHPTPQPRPTAGPTPQARPQPVRRPAPPAQRRPAPTRSAPTPRRPSRSRTPEVVPPAAIRKRQRRLGEVGGLGSIEVVAPPTAATPTPVRIPRTTDAWRRAIVLSELLAPPVSLRDGHF